MLMRTLVALLALVGAAHAQPAQINPALFVARDADSTMYLFGTVHVRRAGAPWGDAEAQAALAEADEVWTEIPISPEADAQIAPLTLRLGAAPPGRPLSSWLTAEEHQRLKQLCARLGVPAETLEGMRPWLAGMMLSMLPMLQAGYDPEAGVDRAIDAAADAAGKTMRSFETAEQQLRMIAGLDDDLQHAMLIEAIDEADEGAALLDQLSAAWERGDLYLLEAAVITELRAEYPALYDVMFTRRNNAWMEVLMREMDGAGVDFVAVGAGHLLGEDGLIAQLRGRGVSVERVN